MASFKFICFTSTFLLLLEFCAAHSLLSFPMPTNPQECKLGGRPSDGELRMCPGPCDLSNPRLLLYTNPREPAVFWRRGQNVTIKYQRNNHGPGGFVRFTIVPVDKMLDKAVHSRNAFHYSCWGADPVAAKNYETSRDAQGYSVSGSDGRPGGKFDPNITISYYTTDITIPDVIPNGFYVLGFVWYGGIGGSLEVNRPEKPASVGHFGDYWSCSFIEISGGKPLRPRWTPKFENNMKQKFPNWARGCYSAADAPGKCTYEPCQFAGRYQVPAPFKNGASPPVLRRRFFRGRRTLPKQQPVEVTLREVLQALFEFRFKGRKG